DDGTDPWTPSHLEAGITLRPYNTRPSGGTKQDLIRRMAVRLAELPGYEIAFRQPIIDGGKDYFFDPPSQLSVKIYGDDLRELRRETKLISRQIGSRSEIRFVGLRKRVEIVIEVILPSVLRANHLRHRHPVLAPCLFKRERPVERVGIFYRY